MADQAQTPEDTRQQYPPYVQTPDQQRRWDVARQAAILVCGTNGQPATDPDSEDVWYWTRGFYFAPIPTDA